MPPTHRPTQPPHPTAPENDSPRPSRDPGYKDHVNRGGLEPARRASCFGFQLAWSRMQNYLQSSDASCCSKLWQLRSPTTCAGVLRIHAVKGVGFQGLKAAGACTLRGLRCAGGYVPRVRMPVGMRVGTYILGIQPYVHCNAHVHAYGYKSINMYMNVNVHRQTCRHSIGVLTVGSRIYV